MKEVIQIEICKSYKEGLLSLRIGDINGSIESSNVTEEEVLSDIGDVIDELVGGKNE